MIQKTTVILAIVLLAALWLVPAGYRAGNVQAAEVAEAEETKENIERNQPFLVQITDSDPSIAYVLIRMPDPIGLLPLPIEGEYTRTIRQTMADGTEA